MSAAVVVLMSADEARHCVNAVNGHMRQARRMLLELYEREGWRALGYESWRACVVAEFEQSQAYLYRQLQAAEIEREISPIGERGWIPESHLRELAPLSPDLRRAVAAAVDFDTTTAAAIRQKAALFSSTAQTWDTPPHIIDAVVAVLGPIDLDPCCSLPNVPAARHYTEADDGLTQPWSGHVYCNPPYDDTARWVDQLVGCYTAGAVDQAVLLVAARTDTRWWQPLIPFPVCFIRGRLRFSGAENSAPFPSAAFYLGPDTACFARGFAHLGPVYEARPESRCDV